MADNDYKPGSLEWELEISRRHYIQSVEAVHDAQEKFADAIETSITQAIHLGEARKALELARENE